MAKQMDIEDHLSLLAGLREEQDSSRIQQELETALKQKRSGLLVAKAAELIAELGVVGLESLMEQAFDRLMVQPLKRDKGCLGKTALAKALVEVEHSAARVFKAGLPYTQLEPAWGGPVDTAAQLRGWCAHGLVRSRYPNAVLEITPRLVDPERPARLAAVDALGDSGQTAAEAVLRLKILCGDEEPEVLSECFNSLFRIEPHRSLEFVAGFLDDQDANLAEAAALGLGESRLEEAVDLLHQQADRTVDEERRRSLYLGLSLTRRQRALDLLVDEVDQGPIGRARDALKALAVHSHDTGLRERLEEMVDPRRDRDLDRIWREDW